MDMYQKREMRKNKKMNEDTKSLPSTSINWYPGHMAKTRREIKDRLPLVDIVYEVIDARMPISSRIIDLDDLVKNKPRILIVTKYDLCDNKVTDKILDNYIKNGETIVKVDLLHNNGIDKIFMETNKLNDKINEIRVSKGMKPRSARVLVVGSPNVGKSTLINKLVGKKAVLTGNKPGVTKTLSWIRIGKNIELLDSPGILWPKLENQNHAFNLASLSSIKEEILNLEELSIYILNKMIKLYPENLEKRYGISTPTSDVVELLDIIGKKRGAYIKGGEIDYDKVYKIIISDLKDGSLGKVTFDRLGE